jgi:hypothetical protein
MSIRLRRGLLLVALIVVGVVVGALMASVVVRSPTEAQSLDPQQASTPPDDQGVEHQDEAKDDDQDP